MNGGGPRLNAEHPAVCVYCSSSNAIDPHYLDLAAQVGTELARRGAILVSGGGRVSMMGALARSARAAGGRTVGIIPHFLVGWEVADDDADELVVVTTMRERKAEMDRRSDAFLILPGGLGTMEELFEVWTTRGLGEHDRPVIVLDPDGVFDALWRGLDDLVGRGFIRPEVFASVEVVRTVDAAFERLESAAVLPAASGA